MAPRKQAPGSPLEELSKKKVKLDGNGKGQASIGAFFQSPGVDGSKNKTKSKQVVINVLSDSDPGDDFVEEYKPVASSSQLRISHPAVINLDEVESSEDEKLARFKKNEALLDASVTPKKPKVEIDQQKFHFEAEDKPVISLKGKGKATVGESPGKLFVPPSDGPSPVIYPLDNDIFAFDPSSDISTATWPRSASGTLQIPYSFLTAAFVLVSATRGRLIITTIITNTLRTVIQYQPEVLRETVYLITNHVAPAYEGVELGVGGQVLGKALKAVSGVTSRDLKQLWNQHGDMGDVAFAAKAKLRTLFASQPLTISSLYNNLVTLTGLKGSGTVNKKADIVQRMLVAAKGEEVRFLVRTLVSHLRIGAVRLTVTASLARAFCMVPSKKCEDTGVDSTNTFYISSNECDGIKAIAKTVKEGKDDPRRLVLMQRLASAEGLVREVYVRHPNYDSIVPALLSVGLRGLSEAIPLSVGTPLSPMLGQITRDLGDVAKRLGMMREFAAEWKYDGQRVQIHCERRPRGHIPPGETQISSKKGGGQWVGDNVYVRLFSRHLEDMTGKYPDILQLMPQLLSPIVIDDSGAERGVQSFIVDAEIVAIDPHTKALLTFQTLTNRARKDVNINEVKVKVGVFAFDLMYLNGQTLINRPFRERRNLLKSRFPPREPSEPTIARWDHVKCMEGFPNNLEPIRQFMLEAISEKCEGLMLKLLDSIEPIANVDDIKREESDQESEQDEQDDPGGEIKGEEQGAVEEMPDAAGAAKKGRRKALLATYEPDKRVESWLKVKRDYGDLGDSLDVVPIGAWHGQGRKTGWWSPILLAVYSPETGGFQALCKCISGFTDIFYKDLNERYKKGSENCSRTLKTYVDSALTPDVWWEPSEVWEIRGADLTLSPVYTAALGLVSAERGLSLRFPRFIKLRPDKSIEQATTPDDLAAAYERQSEGHKHNKPDPGLSKEEADDIDSFK